MTASSTEAVVRKFVSTKDAAETYALLSPDLAMDDWMTPGTTLRGRDTVVQEILTPIAIAFPDAEFTVQDMIVGGTRAAVRGQFSATFTEPYFGLSPHGRRMRWTAHDIYEVTDGRISRIWWGNDSLYVARELGALPHDGRPW